MLPGKPAEASISGALAIAVPLESKGLWLAHQRHGQLPWRDLVAPAANLARAGFPAHPYLSSALTAGQGMCVSSGRDTLGLECEQPRWECWPASDLGRAFLRGSGQPATSTPLA